jgi:cell division cycle 14
LQGPYGKRKALGFGRFTLIPSDYWDVFKAKNIRAIVRLNNKEYDRAAFIQAGFIHHDLFFTDCSTPSDDIVDKFLRLAEEQEGSIAVHCLAGLGRTGTLIAMWMMKHQGWTANECIAWLRIVRPGNPQVNLLY